MRRVLTAGLLLLLLLVALPPACTPSAPRKNVLVVVIDALRADHLSYDGYPRATSPNIDALARDSLVFSDAHAQSPWTKPSIPTLFTSLYPIQHGVYEGETRGASGRLESDVLDERFTTLAEAFRAAGYETAAFVNNAHLLPGQGFAQGFDRYEHASFEAGEINRLFEDFLEHKNSGPFFGYLHYLDVHWPFQPSAEYAGRFRDPGAGGVFDQPDWGGLRERINDGSIQLSGFELDELVARHDATIVELDARIGELMAMLESRGLLADTIVLLTSDHGEELMDHGRVGHGGTLFEEVLRIPMLLRLPGLSLTGRRLDSARLLDVYPTLLAAAEIPIPEGLEGRSLLAEPDAVEVIAETRHKRRYRVSLTRDGWKYVRSYRAPGTTRVDSRRPETFGLQPGMRLKAKGFFASDNKFYAEKVTLKDASDNDVEVSGRITRLASETEPLQVEGLAARVDSDLLARYAERTGEPLAVGAWIKLEGLPDEDGILVADKLERLSPDRRKVEIEGIIREIEVAPTGAAEATVGSTAVVVSRETRVRGGGDPGEEPGLPAVSADEDPFRPERLLARRGLRLEEALYNLSADPNERTNLAERKLEQLSWLRKGVDDWLRRMAVSPHRTVAARQVLDSGTTERLRALGYIE